MSKQTLTTEEARGIARTLAEWNNRVMSRHEYPIMLISVRKDNSNNVQLHRSGEFTNDQIKEFLQVIISCL